MRMSVGMSGRAAVGVAVHSLSQASSQGASGRLPMESVPFQRNVLSECSSWWRVSSRGCSSIASVASTRLSPSAEPCASMVSDSLCSLRRRSRRPSSGSNDSPFRSNLSAPRSSQRPLAQGRLIRRSAMVSFCGSQADHRSYCSRSVAGGSLSPAGGYERISSSSWSICSERGGNGRKKLGNRRVMPEALAARWRPFSGFCA